jgi:hypothetical protein
MPEAEEMKGLVILRGFLMRELRVDNSSSSFNLIFFRNYTARKQLLRYF